MSLNLNVHSLLNGSLDENSYFVYADGSKTGVLIDPGAEAEKLDKAIQATGVKPVAVIATHGHFDHVGKVHYFQEKYQAKFFMHEGDTNLLEALPDNYSFYGMGETVAPKVDQLLSDKQSLELAGLNIKVIHTPGHSPGGICLYFSDSGNLFSGDTLFKMSIGRSDFPGGSHENLVDSIKSKLFVLPLETKVYPGHGEATTLGEEKSRNPFLL